MGLVSAIAALCKAVPILERLFLGVADAVREAKAKARYEAKLDHIDAAMRLAGRLPDGAGTEWSEGVDCAPAIHEGRTIRANLDEGSIEESRGT
jgi:hypothetical protein